MIRCGRNVTDYVNNDVRPVGCCGIYSCVRSISRKSNSFYIELDELVGKANDVLRLLRTGFAGNFSTLNFCDSGDALPSRGGSDCKRLADFA
jgi:hypothetical protein